MNKFSFEKLADREAARIYEKLEHTEPGTREYKELQNQLGAYEIMKEKRNSGKISKAQWIKFVMEFLASSVLMFGALTADMWIPSAMSKLKLEESVTRLTSKLFK